VANQIQEQPKPGPIVEIAQPDRFQKSAGAGLDYLRDRRGPLFAAGALIIGGAIVVFFVIWLFSSSREKAGDKLAWISDAAARPIDKEGLPAEKDRATGRPALPHFASEEEKQKVILDEWTKFQKDYSGTAASTAKLAEASILFEQAKYPEASAGFDNFVKTANASAGVLAITRENFAYSLEAQNNIDGAIEAFKSLYQDDPKGFYADNGRLHVARLLEKKGEKDKAIAEYKAIITDFEASAATQEAEQRLRALGIEPPKNDKEPTEPKEIIEE
jgi:tetratricopeptide (TPR) repeat protein